MKVSELTGIKLDYFACAAAGLLRMIPGTMEEKLGDYSPSTNWRLGGPIIERERMELRPESNGQYYAIALNGADSYGPTPLIAAMRAYVASKFGDEVDDAQPQSAG
jgi:hypothetical protein